ncbi:MAG: diguanylate cyclase [Campylobacterota bacterium]|nr:diguanylate cyclase [Campylobacterota bacterium]
MGKFTILAVDDNTNNIFTLRCLLEDEFKNIDMQEALNYQEALEKIIVTPPNLILLDVQMPEVDGFELANMLKSDSQTKDIPIIFLTAFFKEDEFVQRGYDLGAVDYLIKPIEEKRLYNKIHFHIKMHQQEEKLKKHNITLKKQAIIDQLTQLYSRRHFDDTIEIEMQRAIRYKTALSMIIADIDFFKKVNDTYGHIAGDDILADFANIIKNNIRSIDMAFRYGGEEFVILLPNTTAQEAKELTKKLRIIVNSHNFKNPNSITCSYGISQYKEKDSKETFFKKADEALYFVKENGRNNIAIK